MIRSGAIAVAKFVFVSAGLEVIPPLSIFIGAVFTRGSLRTKGYHYIELKRMYARVPRKFVECHKASNKRTDNGCPSSFQKVEKHGNSVPRNEQSEELPKADPKYTEHHCSESGIDVGKIDDVEPRAAPDDDIYDLCACPELAAC